MPAAPMAATTSTPLEMPHHLVIGRAAWWIPVPGQGQPRPRPRLSHLTQATQPTRPDGNGNADADAEDAQKLSFADALKDLLQNLSFHCYGKLVEHGRRCPERFFWLIFHITALSILIAYLWDTYKNEQEELITTVYNPLYPSQEVQFPTISVCSLNRISKQAVLQYADQLSEKDPLKRNISFFYDELQTLGYLYFRSDDMDDYQHALRFQSFLDNHDTEPDELFYNTRRRMQALTPNCSDILVHCRLGSRSFECMQHFEVSLTVHGFCCTFNNDGFFRQNYGFYTGLRLTLKASSSDYFHKTHSLDGFSILISEPYSYPDPYSGGVCQRFAQMGQLTLLPLKTKIFETVQEARRMSPTARNCHFDNEKPHIFKGKYSFSKCISACRGRSMLSLCQCVPFTLPLKFSAHINGRVFCTLQHLECLKRYEFKWLNVITSRANVTGLEHEMEDSLYCPDCLPSCSEMRYYVRGAMALSLRSLTKTLTNGNGNGNGNTNGHGYENSSSTDGNNSYDYGNGTELAVVRIYFAEGHIQYFRQIIKSAWYEIFSTIGNICGIIAGFSLIGICELLFFLAKQLWHACKAELAGECFCNGASPASPAAKAKAQHHHAKKEKMELLILP